MGPINRFRSPAVLMVVLLLLVGAPFKPVPLSSSLTEEQQTVASCPSVGFCSLRRPATQGGTCTKTPWQLNRDQDHFNHFNNCNLVEPHDHPGFDGACQSGCKFYLRKAGWEKAELVNDNGLGTIIVTSIASEVGEPGYPDPLEHLYWKEFEHDTYISCCRTSGDGADDCTAELCYYFLDTTDHGGKSSKNPEKPATVLPETTEPNGEPTGRNDGDGEERVNPAVSVKPNVAPQSADTLPWYDKLLLAIAGIVVAAVIAGITRVCFCCKAGNVTLYPQENLALQTIGADDHSE